MRKQERLIEHLGCGTPTAFWAGAIVDGKTITYCPECEELNKQQKRCLTCEKTFRPGCANKFICKYCVGRNQRAGSDNGYE